MNNIQQSPAPNNINANILTTVYDGPLIEYHGNGNVMSHYRKIYLNGTTNGALHLDFGIDDASNYMAYYCGSNFSVYALTPHAHIFNLTGSLTWDGTNTEAVFDANVGSFIHFTVLSDIMICVTNKYGITFNP